MLRLNQMPQKAKMSLRPRMLPQAEKKKQAEKNEKVLT
jgi:hypothetical protein